MLVPIIGLGWTLVLDATLIALAFIGVVLFCRLLDRPRRNLVDEIRRRPSIIVRWRRVCEMTDDVMANEYDWNADEVRRIQEAAGCAGLGCRLRYLGEMESQPSHFFRHERFAEGCVFGGDVVIGNYAFYRTTARAVRATLIARLEEHHEASRIVGALPYQTSRVD